VTACEALIGHLLGVFTVNAKHHPHTKVWVGGDTFIVGGHRVDYIRRPRNASTV